MADKEDTQYVSKYREIEMKYYADSISIQKFTEFAEKFKPTKFVEVGSFDHYYDSNGQDFGFEFLRYREGPQPELTIKEKLSDKNNNNRIEVDLPLDPERCTRADVKAFCDRFKFEHNVSIFKYCYIYWYENLTLVYYIVYDSDMKEKNRYIEIEARKDIEHADESVAVDIVKKFEVNLAELGITPHGRLKKSQWEINRKDKSKK